MDEQGERRQVERLRAVRRERDGREAAHCLRELESACRGDANVMPRLLDAANAQCTLQEMCDVMRDVFGLHVEAAIV
jgi:methylmalonyl-CoA mutase N-terminal domain/subunit